MGRDYTYISADSHLEGAGLDEWPLRVPKQYQDRAPRRITMPNGGYGIIVEGRAGITTNNGLSVFAGKSPEQYRPEEPRHVTDAGSGPPEQRLREQDVDGIDAEVLFTGVGGPPRWLGIKNDDAYGAVVRAYNDWLAEDYCSAAPDRLLGIGVIPQRGIDGAVAEMEHCAKLGLKGVVLGAFPSGEQRYPKPEDDRFWAAALDLNMPVTVHVAVSRTPAFKYDREPQGDQEFHTDPLGHMVKFALEGGVNAAQLVLAGVFDRFPSLRIYFAENQIGWIPHFFETMDEDYKLNRYWAERLFGVKQLSRLPSEYLKEHCFWGFVYNPIGVELRHHIGVGHIMWSTDFPHIRCAWPNTMAEVEEVFAAVPADEKHKMVAGNAIEFFHLG